MAHPFWACRAIAGVSKGVGGGRDGRAAAVVARVRGAVPRRGGLRPLAAREAVAGRGPLPGLRPRRGLGGGPRGAGGPWGRARGRLTPQCAACERRVSVPAGTALHGSHLPLRTWFLVLQLR